MIRLRSPVKREGAERYLLLTLVSFAASVVLTRIYLELTGYPQIRRRPAHRPRAVGRAAAVPRHARADHLR
ncbi:MAG: hypothetical protein U0521_08520 [Anaerolineae bacterium]